MVRSQPASSRRNKLAGLTVGGARLQDLSLDFTLPGYSIDLKVCPPRTAWSLIIAQPNGALVDVDDSNLEEYLERVLDMTLGTGVALQVRAFQEGTRPWVTSRLY